MQPDGKRAVVPTLTHEEAKAFYDRLGARQDWQRFYENPATEDLVRHAAFDRARAVFEFGCGTGAFAANLLAGHLPPDATYTGVDLSETMVTLARRRTSAWRGRAKVRQTGGSVRLEAEDGGFDRFVCNYVLDLLSEDDIGALLAEAHRVLSREGRSCLVSLTAGVTPLSRLVTGLWRRVYAVRPKLLGGCRPIEMLAYLSPDSWRVEHRNVVRAFGISSEVIVARRLGGRAVL